MKKTGDYIGNARIITKRDLPKIGGQHAYNKSVVCIELKIVGFIDDYIIYQAKFCEKDSLHLLDDLFINCSAWSYAIKRGARA